MSINFSRSRTQTTYESIIGISSPEELSENKELFKSYELNSNDVQLLKEALKQDAIDYLYNSLVCIAEAIDSVYLKRFSWSTVKLYYSIYYALRASLATKNIAILRCLSLFRLKLENGQTPYNTRNKKYNSTHEGTISHYKDLYTNSDLLLSNNIDDTDAYIWMLKIREIINYKSSYFLEPQHFSIWDYYNDSVDDETFSSVLKTVEEDNYVMCFQEEYAILAIPIKRVACTIKDFKDKEWLNGLKQEQLLHVKNILKYEDRDLTIFRDLFTEL